MTRDPRQRDLAVCALVAMGRRIWLALRAYHDWQAAYAEMPEVAE